MSVESTLQLTRHMAAGDPAAIEAFYRRYFDLMYLEARRCTRGDEATGLDLVHDAMLKALHSIRPLETPAALEAWTRRLVRSVAIDRLRAETRRLRRELRSAPAAATAGVQDDYERIEARRIWMQSQLDAMDAPAADLLRMRYLWGWTLERIGAALGLRSGAVDGRIRRLVAQLQEQSQGCSDE